MFSREVIADCLIIVVTTVLLLSYLFGQTFFYISALSSGLFNWLFESGQDFGTLLAATAALWAAYKWKAQTVLGLKVELMNNADREIRAFLFLLSSTTTLTFDLLATNEEEKKNQAAVFVRDFVKLQESSINCRSLISNLMSLNIRKSNELALSFEIASGLAFKLAKKLGSVIETLEIKKESIPAPIASILENEIYQIEDMNRENFLYEIQQSYLSCTISLHEMFREELK